MYVIIWCIRSYCTFEKSGTLKFAGPTPLSIINLMLIWPPYSMAFRVYHTVRPLQFFMSEYSWRSRPSSWETAILVVFWRFKIFLKKDFYLQSVLPNLYWREPQPCEIAGWTGAIIFKAKNCNFCFHLAESILTSFEKNSAPDRACISWLKSHDGGQLCSTTAQQWQGSGAFCFRECIFNTTGACWYAHFGWGSNFWNQSVPDFSNIR